MDSEEPLYLNSPDRALRHERSLHLTEGKRLLLGRKLKFPRS